MTDTATYLRLALTLEPALEAGPRPPAFSAAALRGMLGKALVDRFCPFGEPRCQATKPGGTGTRTRRPPSPSELCRLAGACPYGILFAAGRSPRPPFALFAPAEREAAFASLELTLYGPACHGYAWVLQAVVDALAERAGDPSELVNESPAVARAFPGALARRADAGVAGPTSRRRNAARGDSGAPAVGRRFIHKLSTHPGGWRLACVERVRPDRSTEPLAGGHPAELPADLVPDLLAFAPEPFLAPAPVAVELLSPTRLLVGGKPLPLDHPVPFEVLVKSALDRFAGLYGRQASPVLSEEIRPAVEAEAARVPLLEQDVRPAPGSHHSRRSRRRLDLGGTVGRLVYGEAAASFFHVLRAAEVLHVGKNATFGCGRIRVDLV